MPAEDGSLQPGEMLDPNTGEVIADPNYVPPADPPVDPPVDPTPVDPPVDPAPASHTIGDDFADIKAKSDKAKASAEARDQAIAAAKDDADALASSKAKGLADLKKLGGGVYEVNPDGTATATWTGDDGFTTEVLKPMSTVIPEDAPSV